MSTLPPVRLNNHAYQYVTASVARTPPRMKDVCKPASKMKVGTCQTVTSTARIRVARSGERSACRRG
jgi:hypothetical protein